MQQKVIITGGPGTGKTTLIEALEKRGFTCIPEISRQLTLEARKNGVDYLFLNDPLGFSNLLLEGRAGQYLEAEKMKEDIIFFDRGIPDIHAYMDFFKTKYPKTFIEKSKKYTYDTIFLLPPWEKIYTTDSERFESYELSISIYEHVKNAYSSLGYQLIEVPIGTVEKRVNFMIKQLGAAQ